MCLTSFLNCFCLGLARFMWRACEMFVDVFFPRISLQTIKLSNGATGQIATYTLKTHENGSVMMFCSVGLFSLCENNTKWKLLWFEALLNDFFIASNVNFNNLFVPMNIRCKNILCNIQCWFYCFKIYISYRHRMDFLSWISIDLVLVKLNGIEKCKVPSGVLQFVHVRIYWA